MLNIYTDSGLLDVSSKIFEKKNYSTCNFEIVSSCIIYILVY